MDYTENPSKMCLNCKNLQVVAGYYEGREWCCKYAKKGRLTKRVKIEALTGYPYDGDTVCLHFQPAPVGFAPPVEKIKYKQEEKIKYKQEGNLKRKGSW